MVWVILLLLLTPEAMSAQCAMCRSVFASEEGQQLAGAFRSGILFLLPAPFLAFGVVATLAVRSRLRLGTRTVAGDNR